MLKAIPAEIENFSRPIVTHALTPFQRDNDSHAREVVHVRNQKNDRQHPECPAECSTENGSGLKIWESRVERAVTAQVIGGVDAV
jgi:hypothetical protein